MFEDSLIESAGVLKTKRKATTLVSLVVESVLVALLAGLPLLYTEALPTRWAQPPVALGAPAPASPASAEHRAARSSNSNIVDGFVREPKAIPKGVPQIIDTEPPPPLVTGIAPGVPGGTGSPTGSGFINSILRSAPSMPVPKPSIFRPLRISQGVAQGFLVHEVKPLYPPLARQTRIQGAVVLQAIISRDGRIEGLQVVSGHPMLAPAAIEAVKQWRYRPYTLNREPVEVETQITVNFILGGG